jgi:hypothetical protein
MVRGTSVAVTAIKRVVVNGMEASPVAADFSQWQAVLDSADSVTAYAEDDAGNVELSAHTITPE